MTKKLLNLIRFLFSSRAGITITVVTIIVTSLSLFWHFYRQNGNFRQAANSTAAAIYLAVVVNFGFEEGLPEKIDPTKVSSADAFSPKAPISKVGGRGRGSSGRQSGISGGIGGSGSPSGGDGDGNDNGGSLPSAPSDDYVDQMEQAADLYQGGESSSELDETDVETPVGQCQSAENRDWSEKQITSFLDNNNVVNIDACLGEVKRRALAEGRPNFSCSRERFKQLATEDTSVGVTEKGAREAITILHGEILNLWKDAKRGVGPDFEITGLGKYEHLTHIDVTGPTGRAIQSKFDKPQYVPRLETMAKKLAVKKMDQAHTWSDPNSQARTTLVLAPDASFNFPKSSSHVGLACDFVDVHPSEQKPYHDAFKKSMDARQKELEDTSEYKLHSENNVVFLETHSSVVLDPDTKNANN